MQPHLDEDYDYGTKAHTLPHQQQQQQPFVRKGLGAMPLQKQLEEEDFPSNETKQQHQQQGVDPPASSLQNDMNNYAREDNGDNNRNNHDAAVGDDDALLNLDQLEELHDEAERMKALGNKHMAAQEYTRAYNAYSAALQLSPVGPSSHVFLSNRSAALLSLKRYSAAATDARRAIALAPTFGKAHARLGQSLYFLKDYERAVSAYDDAIHYEPDNPITNTYLEKARSKWNRQKEKALRNRSGGEEVSVLTAESSIQPTIANSVATDPNDSAAVVTTGFRGQSKAIMRAVGGGMTANKTGLNINTNNMRETTNVATPTLNENTTLESQREYDEEEDDDYDLNLDDPDFDEALRIQERANRYLANKNYKYAIEEYTAALFLIPDDENLSPELHLGRAHALNGSRRHESAKIDSQLALKSKPTPEAYSTLAKSLFYMKDYKESIMAFGQCKRLLPPDETLSMFDRAYLQKAEAAMLDEMKHGKNQSIISSSQSVSSSSKTTSRLGSSAPIPKLKPPKFVSREEALTRTPNMPAMPKQWPQQSFWESNVVKHYGEEREVTFLSEALGIKLNRGPDGVVRVIEVSPDDPGSPIAREGNIKVGDLIREAVGVDIRRPITNIMWGDTVALIKMAPRPIVLVVATESTESIMDGRKRAAHNALTPTSAAQYFPSNASTEESVKEQIEREEELKQQQHADVQAETQPELEQEQRTENVINSEIAGKNKTSVDKNAASDVHEAKSFLDEDNQLAGIDGLSTMSLNSDQHHTSTADNYKKARQHYLEYGFKEHRDCSLAETNEVGESGKKCDDEEKEEISSIDHSDEKSEFEKPQQIEGDISNGIIDGEDENIGKVLPNIDLRDEEAELLGAEIIFENNQDRCYNGWDNLRWMAYSGIRKISAAEPVYRYFEGRKGFLWSKDEYVPRKLAVYEHPNVILILREASCLAELEDLMELPADAKFDETALSTHLFVESVIDPKTAKLRLSPLTTVTSIIPEMSNDCARRRSSFELINPTESVSLSAVKLRKGCEKSSFADSGAFLETSGVEYALTKSICSAYEISHDTTEIHCGDSAWKHQIILGTLHSFVILGNEKHLDLAIHQALRSKNGQSHLDLAIQQASEKQNPRFLNPRIIDAIDESGKTALHYACESRFSSAVISLVKAGADVNLRAEEGNTSPCHICAKNLDFKSLGAILAVSQRPNEVDYLGQSPMYLAITEGRSVGGFLNPLALERCIEIMVKFGGQVGEFNRHPTSVLASQFQADELKIILKYSQYKYPLRVTKEEDLGISLSALDQYPVHFALITLKQRLHYLTSDCNVSQQHWREFDGVDSEVNKVLKILFSCGFEPNERIEGLSSGVREIDELVDHIGFTPMQVVLAATLDVLGKKEVLGEVLYVKMTDMLVNIMVCLILHGGRVFPDPPPLSRCAERRQFRKKKEEPQSNDDSMKRSQVKTQGSVELTILLGKTKLVEAQSFWKHQKLAPAPSNTVFHDDKSNIENSLAPGGSDDRNCSICWKKFGMMTRKHRCRISRKYVCELCSKKKIFVNDEEHRVSDGQFLMAKAEELKKTNNMLHAAKTHELDRKPQIQEEMKQKQENMDRDSLFGGIMTTVAKTFGGGAEDSNETSKNESNTLVGLSNQLNQTRDVLNERGDKLSTLSDKSDKLVCASQDFAAMAKELNRKSNQSFFSL